MAHGSASSIGSPGKARTSADSRATGLRALWRMARGHSEKTANRTAYRCRRQSTRRYGYSQSDAVRLGASVLVIQRMLGHSSAAMTLDVYADLFDSDLDDICGQVDSAIERESGECGQTWARTRVGRARTPVISGVPGCHPSRVRVLHRPLLSSSNASVLHIVQILITSS